MVCGTWMDVAIPSESCKKRMEKEIRYGGVFPELPENHPHLR